jgi:hypothetical protein
VPGLSHRFCFQDLGSQSEAASSISSSPAGWEELLSCREALLMGKMPIEKRSVYLSDLPGSLGEVERQAWEAV